MVKRKITIS